MGTFDYKAWLLQQTSSAYTMREKDDRHILIENEFGTAQITLYDLDIVEFSITAARDGQNVYWLHFQSSNEEHAKELTLEMLEAFLALKNRKGLRILLSCTVGMTTTYFAEELSSAAASLGLEWTFDAVSYTELYEKGRDYDLILLAPQIGYLYKKLSAAMPKKAVALLPTAIFAGYDVFGGLEFVKSSLESFSIRQKEKKKARNTAKTCCDCVENDDKLLTVAFRIQEDQETRIYYRVYDKHKVVLDEYVKKPNVQFYDMGNVLDIVTALHPDLHHVAVAVPGMIGHEGSVSFAENERDVFEMQHWLEENWNVKARVYNNTNAAAMGFALAHPQYGTIIYHSQPYGLPGGGQGYVMHGHLHKGARGLAGEFKFSLPRMQFSDDMRALARTDQGMLELVSKALLNSITVLDPDVVAVRSLMTSDMNELKKRLEAFVPAEYLPEFVYVAEDRAYFHDGLLALYQQDSADSAIV